MKKIAIEETVPIAGRPAECATKRDKIMHAAADIFCQEGFSGASIDAVASRAGVSRQTIYNQIGDKEKLFRAVVQEITDQSMADFFRMLETFPDQPVDLKRELTEFSVRLLTRYSCDPNGRWIARMVEREGARYPELFSVWREYGPGRKYPAIAARLAQLALNGHLHLTDAGLAAKQFMSLLTAEIRTDIMMGHRPGAEEIEVIAANAVDTFLLAFGPRAKD